MDRYLMPKEVEKLTGFKLQSLANARHKGRGLPYYKVGRSVRYKLSDVISFMEHHRVNPTEQID